MDVGESEQVERTNERTFGTNTTMNQTRTTFAILRYLNHRYDDDMTTAPLAAAAAAAGTLPFPPSISVFVERCRP